MENLYPLFTTGSITSNSNMLFALVIGIAFGVVLERSGFGKSTNIASIFYFRNLRVEKVMVSAILTTATWIVIFSYAGILDFNQLYIPTTYLWPYVVGGALFGFGMLMSGWCPGTAVIGLASGKLDAAIFILGAMFGMYFYFYFYDFIEVFANSGNMGKYTFHEALGGSVHTTSYIITILLGVGLMVFMSTVKKIRDKKGEDI